MDALVLGSFYARHRPIAAVNRARDAFTVLEANTRDSGHEINQPGGAYGMVPGSEIDLVT